MLAGDVYDDDDSSDDDGDDAFSASRRSSHDDLSGPVFFSPLLSLPLDCCA